MTVPASESRRVGSRVGVADGPPTSAGVSDWLSLVRESVETLRYGVVQLVVHDGRVTQIERTEKMRLPAGQNEVDRRS